MWLLNQKEKLIINPAKLSAGMIINSSPNHVAWYDIPTHAIRAYQFLRWHKNYKDTHSMYYVGTAFGKFKVPHVFEVTTPRAKYTPLSEILEKDKTFTAYSYTAAIPSKSDLLSMLKVCDDINGTWYDIGELFDFMIQHILGYPTDEFHQWFDFGTDNLVCSVGVMVILMSWWKDRLKELGLPRPGGEAHVERCDPATFANHPTFVHLGELLEENHA